MRAKQPSEVLSIGRGAGMGSRSHRFTLRFTIAGLLMGLLVMALSGAVVIASLVRSRSVEATSRTILGEVSRGMGERLRSRVEPAQDILRECIRAAERGYFQIGDMKHLAEQLAERIRHDTRFESLAFLTPDDRGCGAMRLPDDVILLAYTEPGKENVFVREHLHLNDTREVVSHEPGGLVAFRNVVWYELGAASDGPVWTSRYKRPVDGTWGRACAAPLRDGDRLLGVFGIGYGQAFVGEYIRTVKAAETGRLFGVHAETGKITASPSEKELDIFGPVIREGLSRHRDSTMGFKPGQPVFESVSHEGTDYIVAFEMQQMGESFRWINAVVVPEKELVGFLDRYVSIALVGIGILLLVAMVFAQLLSKRISRPLRVIASDLGKVAAFDLTTDSAPPTLIREIAVVGDAVDRMKAGLRSFSRYVPTELVRGLLREGQEARLDGRLRPLTLFFSDIKGFTNVSEGMAPQALVDALGDYLDVVTKAVVAEQGTIDKFMGDGVLAFFNAPHQDQGHVAHACSAALLVQKTLVKARLGWEKVGLPAFHTRIGLHTAEVLVGNIGTPDRFSYTVLGDGVNLAARLESLNKVYSTWILASEETRTAAGDGFEWRWLDRTAVAGRAEGGNIYELLGEVGTIDDTLINNRDGYEEALAAYFDRRFHDAAQGFESVLTALPGDGAASVLLERSRLYIENPPPDDWLGVFVQTKK